MAARTVLHSGATGAGKTSVCSEYVRHTYETSKKITRLITFPAGGSLGPLVHQIKAGLIEHWEVPAMLVTDIYAHLMQLAKGNWPKLVHKGGVWGVEFDKHTPGTWARVGTYIIDGLTKADSLMMNDHLMQQRNMGGKEPGVRWEEKARMSDGTEVAERYMSAGWGNYGQVQRTVENLITHFCSLPVSDFVVFTALDAQAMDEEAGRQTIIGPAFSGNKLTPIAASWFGNHFRHSIVQKADPDDPINVKQIWVCFISDHLDPATKVLAKAKLRVRPEQRADFIKNVLGGKIYLDITGKPSLILDLIRAEDEYIRMAETTEKQWMKDVDSKRIPKEVVK